MDIKDYVIKKATVRVPLLNLDNVYITIAKLSSDDVLDIRRKCSIGKRLNPVTKQWEEQLDNEKFLRKYAEQVIVSWEGLKGRHLLDLLMVDIPKDMLDTEVECNSNNKYTLIEQSTDVDNFITGVLGDVSVFNTQISEQRLKK